jgi:hypothetical protein
MYAGEVIYVRIKLSFGMRPSKVRQPWLPPIVRLTLVAVGPITSQLLVVATDQRLRPHGASYISAS